MADQLQGWINNPAQVEVIKSQMVTPFFSAAAPMIKGSGKGKIELLHMNFEKLGIKFPLRFQKIGDCFNGSSEVMMADGSLKFIKDIKVGDKVISHKGNIKNVISLFKKPYNGKMIKLTTQGYIKPLISTPDHKLVQCLHNKNNRWNRADLLNINDYILIPKLPNLNQNKIYDLANLTCKLELIGADKIRSVGSNKISNRFINNSEKLFWLFGIFLAEGSCDYNNHNIPSRITFNLSSKEIFIANKIKSYIKDIFDLDATICSVPSKPSVLYVRISSTLFASFIKQNCYGNVWSKSFNPDFKLESYSNKLSLLEGWIDGDGWNHEMGVTVSKQLANDFFDIANSLGMNVRIQTRPAHKQSKESYSVHLNTNLKTKISKKIQFTQNFVTNLGKAVKIKNIEYVEPESNFVYCIEVEDDNSFICDGYAVHNCVSMGTALAVDALKVTEIVNGDRELWINETSTEDIYSGSRVIVGKGRISGDGSIGAWAVKYISKDYYGTLVRKAYSFADLSKYSGQRARQWGSQKMPQALLDEAKLHPILDFTAVEDYQDVIDSIYNGYPVIICSNQGFSNKRDSDGFCAPKGSWAHCMMLIAFDDEYKRPGCLCVNSWGPAWVTGPKRHNQPDGSFWMDASIVDRIVKQGDSWAISGYHGFKPKPNARVI